MPLPAPVSLLNGVLGTDGTSSQGTGNYGNYPLYIGSRNGIIFPLNGRIYQLIIRGRTSTPYEINTIEKLVNQKTKAY